MIVKQEEQQVVLDRMRRPLRSLRVSVTDRCNLRCLYCMPEEEYVWLPQHDLLSFEEIERLTGIFTGLGVDKVRITGGEPLLRKDLPQLIEKLAGNSRITDLALTTNGIFLGEQAARLRCAGLHRVTVSLDTLQPARFAALARRNLHANVLEGIRAARQAGFTGTKIDAVIIRGFNEDELVPLIEFGKRVHVEVRFLEYMDVGGATAWSLDQVFSRAEMLRTLAKHYGAATPLGENGSAPAERFVLPDGTIFGIVASTTTPFCRKCDRSRLTADGMWLLCLYAAAGINLRQPLRAGASHEELQHLMIEGWKARQDRGAEDREEKGRAGRKGRDVLIPVEALRRDPHLEMHTRGG